MMTGFFLFGGLILAWAFGRNNFSNIFGSAVGTGILPLKLCVFLTGVFLLLGAYFNSSGTSTTLSELAYFTSLSDSFSFSIIVAIIMILLTRLGIPASVAQISIGALIGWNLALNLPAFWDKIFLIVFGWFFSPVICAIMAFLIFKLVRFYLKKYPVPLLYRDIWVRFFWILVGSFTAYSLGANNVPVLMMPFGAFFKDEDFLFILFALAATLGCAMASLKVIKVVSTKLFPLSSVESLIVGFSGAFTLLLFSFQDGFFPALPISISASLIGAIVGVSLAKGGYGLKVPTLLGIIFSWIWAPFFSGLLSYAFILIMKFRGI